MIFEDEKAALRKEFKRMVAIYSEEELAVHSETALHKLENDASFVEAETVMLFWSLPDEISTHAFIEKWSKHKTILLPVIVGDDIYPHVYENPDKMEFGLFHILQPKTKVFDDEIDLVVVPGQAFDKNGHRLGRGKGYYDRFLSKYEGEKIGICFTFQFTDYVPYEDFDIPMDKVIVG